MSAIASSSPRMIAVSRLCSNDRPVMPPPPSARSTSDPASPRSFTHRDRLRGRARHDDGDDDDDALPRYRGQIVVRWVNEGTGVSPREPLGRFRSFFLGVNPSKVCVYACGSPV